VARYDDADRVAPGGCTGRSRATRITCALRQLAICDGLTEPDARNRLPYRALERRALWREFDRKPRPFAVEIFRQLALGLAERCMLMGSLSFLVDAGVILLPSEIDARQRLVIRNQQYASTRTLIIVVVQHSYSLVSECQSCITAYARHGRQVSPASSTRRAFFSFNAFMTPRSV
jgi:hypothetical protein